MLLWTHLLQQMMKEEKNNYTQDKADRKALVWLVVLVLSIIVGVMIYALMKSNNGQP